MTGGQGRLARLAGAAVTAAAAGGLARGVYAVARRRPPGGGAVWTRTNHRGEPVTLLAGPALAVAATVASALSPGLPARTRAALMAAGAGAAAFGGYDDLAGDGGRRGFRGHLGALARGEVTTGAVKLGGIGAAGLAAATLLGGPVLDVSVNAGLVAGSANLVNLFDLRPGRAIKVATLGGALLVGAGSRHGGGRGEGGRGGEPAGDRGVPGRRAGGNSGLMVAAPLGAALALAPADLGERAMLGDGGANALGAMLGVSAAACLPRPARLAVLAGVAGLTAASEVVSFTRVIDRTPVLRWADMLGRRPVAPTRAGGLLTGPPPAGTAGPGPTPARAGGAGSAAAATPP